MSQSLHTPRVKIKQPDGIKYLIQTYFYRESDAQEYIDMLISKSEEYINLKRSGKRVAPLMTLAQLEAQLVNIKKFEIVGVAAKEEAI